MNRVQASAAFTPFYRPNQYPMQVLYFDFFQISRNIRFFDTPFKKNNGCVVLLDQLLFVYFREPQINLCAALRRVVAGFKYTTLLYSEHFADLIVFLQTYVGKKDPT